MANNKNIKTILYVHYQLSELDGSNTHTSAFEYWFNQICENQSIKFFIQSPKLSAVPPLNKKGFIARLKSLIAKYYIRDFRVWLQNNKQKKKEIRLLKELKPDIVLTRFERETVSIIWACEKLGIPLVLEINSPDIEEITAHYRSLPVFKRLFSTDYVLEKSLGAFTVTDNLTNQVKVNAHHSKILRTIPNGVNIDVFKPTIDGQTIRHRLNIHQDSIVIGFVGSFAPWHGIDIIAKTFPQLLDKGFDIHLVLVGQRQAKSNTLINQLIHSKYKDKVSLTGFISLKEIPDYLAAMDITVLANTEDYCSPLKIFEYMAMGKAIVSVNTEAVCQIMRPEKEGLVFERGNSEQFSTQIERLINQPELRTKLGNLARKRVIDKFQWKHNAEAVYALIQDCYATK